MGHQKSHIYFVKDGKLIDTCVSANVEKVDFLQNKYNSIVYKGAKNLRKLQKNTTKNRKENKRKI